MEKKIRKRRACLVAAALIGFMAVEIPGIYFVCDKIQPFIFGLPFLYGYIFICWLYMCLVLFCGYKTSWGRKPLFVKK